jgi:hypothetical protein
LDGPPDVDTWICTVCATAGKNVPPSIRKVMKELHTELSEFVRDKSQEKIGSINGANRAALFHIKHFLRFDSRSISKEKEPLLTTFQRFIENVCSEHELQAAFVSECNSSINNIRSNIKIRLFKFTKDQLLSSFLQKRISRSKEQIDVEHIAEGHQLDKLFEEFWSMTRRDGTFCIAFEVWFRGHTLPSHGSPNLMLFCRTGPVYVFR